MGQPGRLLKLFKQIKTTPTSPSALTGDSAVDEVIRTLDGADIAKLLRFVRNWNANAKTSAVAQGVLYATVKLRPAEDIMKAFDDEKKTGFLDGQEEEQPRQLGGAGGTALKELVDSLIPYTERHLSRIDKLVQQSYVVDYILSEMDDGMIETELHEDTRMDVDARLY